MKRFISVFMVLILLLSVCGCKTTEDDGDFSAPSSSATDAYANAIDGLTYDKEDGTHVVKNNDDITSFAIFSDSHIGQKKVFSRTLERAIEWVNNTDYVDFTFFLGDNIDNGYYNSTGVSESQVEQFYKSTALFKKPYFVIQGNHDPRVPQFEKNMVVECGDVTLVGFFADYYTMDPDNIYKSNGRVSQFQLDWLEDALAKCKGKRVILACHYSIVVDDKNFTAPIPEAQPVPKRDLECVDFGREKILEFAEKYNIELYFNGHEHNDSMPTGVAGTMTDFNIGSLGNEGLFAVVTVDDVKAVVELRNANHTDEVIKTVEYKFTREIVK